MRVPPPGLLKVDRGLLLQDVRERLAERIPHYANLDQDPTDPGWLLLEQAAWLVELLSEQLDAYPYAAVQQFVHMMGGHLLPAHPSVGVLLAEAATEGVLRLDERRPSPWRFFTTQTEDLDSVEFVPVEGDVPLRKLSFKSMCELSADELYLVGPDVLGAGVGGLSMWRAERRRSRVFTREEIWFDAVSNNPDGLIEALENALKQVEERRVGWLALRWERLAREKIRLIAEIRPEGAFARVAPAGIWMGGDLEGDWGTLDGSTWTPVVTIRRHPMLPPHLHDQFPLPGYEEGQILLTDVPDNFPVVELLERKASPMPESVIEAIWATLANNDSRLAVIKPAVRTTIRPPEVEVDLEPAWVAGAIASGVWSQLTQNQPKTVFHVGLDEIDKKASLARVAVVYEVPTGARLPKPQFYAIKEDGAIERTAVAFKERWRMPGPPLERSNMMPLIVSYDVTVDPKVVGLLMVCTQQPKGALLNTLLVANVPAVSDGRTTVIQRNVPTEYSLLYEDVVDRRVIEQLLQEPIPESAAAVLRALSVAYFTVVEQDAVKDYEGIKLDASEGSLTLNAPDARGVFRTFRPGARIRIEWYRRTDGAAGNRPADTVTLVEQPPTVVPRINATTNPLGTFFGADRESPEEAIDRMFGPAEGTPVMASDWERQVRQALGGKARGWFVRCWTYAERALVSTAFWPFPSPSSEPDAEVVRVEAALAEAGPDTLLVVLGPTDEVISDEDLDWARRATQRMVQRFSRRLPTIKHAIVTRFWPLKMQVPEDHDEVQVPCFEVAAMDGEVQDLRGRPAGDLPKAVLVLNAAIASVELRQQELL